MEMHFQTILIILHEPALYNGHETSDFRPPYALRPLPRSRKFQAGVDMHTASWLMPCILSSRALIRTFLDLPIETLLFIPVVTYTRVTYAAIVLIKCFISARAHTCFADLYLETSLGPVSVIEQLLDKLDSVKDQAQGRIPVPAVFYSIFSVVHIWCSRVFTVDIHQDVEDVMEPMLHLNLEEGKALECADVRPSRSPVGEHPGSMPLPASTKDHFDWKDFESMEVMQFDAAVMGSLLEFPDFSGYMNQPFG